MQDRSGERGYTVHVLSRECTEAINKPASTVPPTVVTNDIRGGQLDGLDHFSDEEDGSLFGVSDIQCRSTFVCV